MNQKTYSKQPAVQSLIISYTTLLMDYDYDYHYDYDYDYDYDYNYNYGYSTCTMQFSNFQHYFNTIMSVNFIGGVNQGTHRKPPTCH